MKCNPGSIGCSHARLSGQRPLTVQMAKRIKRFAIFSLYPVFDENRIVSKKRLIPAQISPALPTNREAYTAACKDRFRAGANYEYF